MAEVTAGTDLPPPSPRRTPVPLVLAGLIALHAALLIWSATRNSVAFDEYAHLPAGVAYWHGTLSIYDHSPPLLRMLAALPVIFAGPDVPPPEQVGSLPAKDRHWVYAEQFLRRNSQRYHLLFVLGRLPMIVVSCCGAWIVYRWASTLYGPAGGHLACAAYVLCPNLLAHGSLVGTDNGTAVAMLLAVWLWWRFCRAPSTASLASAAIAIGIAHVCKFTAVLLWPMLAGMAVCMLRDQPRIAWRRAAVGLTVCAVATLLIVNAGYGFKGTGRRAGDFRPQSKAVGWIFERVPTATPVPLPAAMVEGFDAQKWEFEQGLASFLFGRQYAGSRWYYYPVVLLFKTPLATLGLIGIALGLRRFSRDESALLAGLAIFLLGAMLLAGADLGVRYVLPAFPLAFVLIGRIAAVARLTAWTKGLIIVLAIENAWIGPHYLAFVNMLAGGPNRGQFVTNDSNFDWGTDLIALRDWMRGQNVSRVTLAYFGRVNPAIYGIAYDLPGEPSDDEYVAISSHFLVGMQGRLQSRDGGPTGWFSLPFYRELQAQTPVAQVGGGSIRIYRRGDLDAAARQFQFATDEHR